jgi:hypothetical protein
MMAPCDGIDVLGAGEAGIGMNPMRQEPATAS